MRLLSVLEEKGDKAGSMSATRVVALMFAACVCFGIVRMAIGGTLHSVGWPFCALGVATLLAVPLQAFFKFVNAYLKSKPGAAMLERIIQHVVPTVAGSPAPDVSVNVTSKSAEGA